MGRNLDKRIEVSMPVLDKKLISELRSYFALQWSDNQKSRIIDADQTNPYFIEGDAKIDAQQVRYNELKELL
jgi:polyphosphate kinase